VLAVKSPLGYSNEYRIMGSTEKLTMPAISFTGTPTADTSFAILEYGCDLVNWKITTAT
jgi:acetyl-CoA carboxylase alpha subunit